MEQENPDSRFIKMSSNEVKKIQNARFLNGNMEGGQLETLFGIGSSLDTILHSYNSVTSEESQQEILSQIQEVRERLYERCSSIINSGIGGAYYVEAWDKLSSVASALANVGADIDVSRFQEKVNETACYNVVRTLRRNGDKLRAAIHILDEEHSDQLLGWDVNAIYEYFRLLKYAQDKGADVSMEFADYLRQRFSCGQRAYEEYFGSSDES